MSTIILVLIATNILTAIIFLRLGFRNNKVIAYKAMDFASTELIKALAKELYGNDPSGEDTMMMIAYKAMKNREVNK